MFKANEFMTMSVASAKRGVRSRPAHGGAEGPPAAARAVSGVVTAGPGVTPPAASRSSWNRDGPCCSRYLPGWRFLGSRWRTAELGARRLLGVGAWAVARCSSESPAPPAEKPWRQSSFL